jgi:hypothetical protein
VKAKERQQYQAEFEREYQGLEAAKTQMTRAC